MAEATKQIISSKQSENLGKISRYDTPGISLSNAFTHFLGLDSNDASALIDYEKCFTSEIHYKAGETIFATGSEGDGFYVVLSGSVMVLSEDRRDKSSGAGVQRMKRNMVESGQLSRMLSVGSVFGFVDFILKRPRRFSAVAGKDSIIAICHRSGLDNLKKEKPELDRIVDKMLLLCSAVELAAKDP